MFDFFIVAVIMQNSRKRTVISLRTENNLEVSFFKFQKKKKKKKKERKEKRKGKRKTTERTETRECFSLIL